MKITDILDNRTYFDNERGKQILRDVVTAQAMRRSVETMFGERPQTKKEQDLLGQAEEQEMEAMRAFMHWLDRQATDIAIKAIREGVEIETTPCPACKSEVYHSEQTCWHCLADLRARQCA